MREFVYGDRPSKLRGILDKWTDFTATCIEHIFNVQKIFAFRLAHLITSLNLQISATPTNPNTYSSSCGVDASISKSGVIFSISVEEQPPLTTEAYSILVLQKQDTILIICLCLKKKVFMSSPCFLLYYIIDVHRPFQIIMISQSTT